MRLMGKLWILHNHEKRYETVKTNEPVNTIWLSMYPDGVVMVEGTYIVMPLNDDIDEYRNRLIKYMIRKETAKIERANNEIFKLTQMLID